MAAFLHAVSEKDSDRARTCGVALAIDVVEGEGLLAAKVLAGGPDLVKHALELAAAVEGSVRVVAPVRKRRAAGLGGGR